MTEEQGQAGVALAYALKSEKLTAWSYRGGTYRNL